MDFFKKIFSTLFNPKLEFGLGAIVDTRSPAEREAEDIPFYETASASAQVIYKEIPKKEIRTFGDQNQKQKYDCVAETRRKLKRILFKVNKNLDLDFSSVDFYKKRSNYPDPGMIAVDAIRIDRQLGMTLDALVPSDVIGTEEGANALKVEDFNKDIAQVFRTSSDDVVFNERDLDTPCATIQKTRKGIMMWFYFTAREWSQEVPAIIDSLSGPRDPRALPHSVTGIEPALYKGKEGVWIDDSAPFGGIYRRFITREFYEKRNFWASYPINFKFDAGKGDRPIYNGSIVSLQDCLKFEGVFPLNIESTGVYGPVTTQAVKDFQNKYNLQQVGLVGPKTTNKLKELYS